MPSTSVQNTITAAQAAIQSEVDEATALRNRTSALRTTITAATATIATANSTIASQSASIGSLNDSLTSINSQVVALTASLTTEEAANTSLTGQLSDITDALASTQSAAAAAAAAAAADLQANVDAAAAAAAAAAANLASTQADLDAALAALEAATAALNADDEDNADAAGNGGGTTPVTTRLLHTLGFTITAQPLDGAGDPVGSPVSVGSGTSGDDLPQGAMRLSKPDTSGMGNADTLVTTVTVGAGGGNPANYVIVLNSNEDGFELVAGV